MPVAMPTWRKVLLIPEPIPLRARRTTPTAVWASAGLTMPMPTPASMKPGSSAVHSVSVSTARIRRSATADQRQPGAEEQADRELGAELARDRGDEERDQREGQEVQAGVERLAPSTPCR